ncbi:hypothetical protein H2201_004092 [Coniosporium apollinis]|uniref:Uncharacterized protein n=1 Tax=Coniosporium apollinis TaxID=61459 RepID=A0ABQ9NTN8_9PEZI|nr:hypothetical protein H2201_004092 [Coniosporium apollinis]
MSTNLQKINEGTPGIVTVTIALAGVLGALGCCVLLVWIFRRGCGKRQKANHGNEKGMPRPSYIAPIRRRQCEPPPRPVGMRGGGHRPGYIPRPEPTRINVLIQKRSHGAKREERESSERSSESSNRSNSPAGPAPSSVRPRAPLGDHIHQNEGRADHAYQKGEYRNRPRPQHSDVLWGRAVNRGQPYALPRKPGNVVARKHNPNRHAWVYEEPAPSRAEHQENDISFPGRIQLGSHDLRRTSKPANEAAKEPQHAHAEPDKHHGSLPASNVKQLLMMPPPKASPPAISSPTLPSSKAESIREGAKLTTAAPSTRRGSFSTATSKAHRSSAASKKLDQDIASAKYRASDPTQSTLVEKLDLKNASPKMSPASSASRQSKSPVAGSCGVVLMGWTEHTQASAAESFAPALKEAMESTQAVVGLSCRWWSLMRCLSRARDDGLVV